MVIQHRAGGGGAPSRPGSPEQGVGLLEPRPAASTEAVLEEGAGAIPSAPKAGGKMSGAGPEALGTDQTVSWGRGTAVFPQVVRHLLNVYTQA